VCYSYFGYLSDTSNCGCFDNCVGVLIISVLVFTVFLYCFLCIFILICY
jgi:hypothetical protein